MQVFQILVLSKALKVIPDLGYFFPIYFTINYFIGAGNICLHGV
jgi:hypothetical protein